MNEQILWKYVSLAAYKAPQATISRTIKGGIKGIWQRFQRQGPDPQPAHGLEYLSPSALEKVAPAPDWSAAVQAIGAVAEQKIKASDGPGVLLVAGLPGSGNGQILSCLAAALGWRLISPPSSEQIFVQDMDWLEQATSTGTPWVLPDLGKTYLRHVRGLALVRKFVDRLSSGAAGRGVIGCDSWALAYLKRVVPGPFPEGIVAQAFDDHALGRWLGQRAEAGCGEPVRFCQSDTGEPVLNRDPDLSTQGETDVKASAFMNQLAAGSFGIPGIAIDIWKQALKREPDQPVDEKGSEPGGPEKGPIIWVDPWEKLPSRIIPPDMGPASPVLMHSLLIHNGLSRDLAAELLPFSASETNRTARALEAAGIVKEYQGELAISSQWYPSVRTYLNGEGYLTDQF